MIAVDKYGTVNSTGTTVMKNRTYCLANTRKTPWRAIKLCHLPVWTLVEGLQAVNNLNKERDRDIGGFEREVVSREERQPDVEKQGLLLRERGGGNRERQR